MWWNTEKAGLEDHTRSNWYVFFLAKNEQRKQCCDFWQVLDNFTVRLFVDKWRIINIGRGKNPVLNYKYTVMASVILLLLKVISISIWYLSQNSSSELSNCVKTLEKFVVLRRKTESKTWNIMPLCKSTSFICEQYETMNAMENVNRK